MIKNRRFIQIMTINCKNCGKQIYPKTANQIFCDSFCRKQYERKNQTQIEHKEFSGSENIIREFICRQCGKHVLVVDEKDKRTVYCQQACEKKYWREVTKYGRHSRSGNNLSGGMSLQSLIRREREDLK